MDKKMMIEAVRDAQEGIRKRHGGPFGAVVVKDGQVIGRGHNTVVKDNDPTAHGEVNAIRNACKNIDSFDLSGATLYTTCYPCPMCLGAALWARIEKVYYCCDSLDAAAIGFADEDFYKFFENKDKVKELIVRDNESLADCKKLFKEYADSDKILY